MNRLKRLFYRYIKRETDLQRAYRLGFRSGKNFVCHSPHAIDAYWPWLISCGDDVLISSNVTILAHDASPGRGGVSTKIGIVSIGNNVFVGANTIILCDTRIGNDVVIGAGSVVTSDIPSNSVYAGNPAKRISSFDEWRKKHKKKHETSTIYSKYSWDKWCDASEEERIEQRKKLEESFGYLT